MPNKTTQEILDIIKIQTVKDLNSTDFSKYASKLHKSWVKHIQYPVLQKDLDRVCDLSKEVGSEVILGWMGGELFYRVRALPQIKKLEQMPLFNDEIFGAAKRFKVIPIQH